MSLTPNSILFYLIFFSTGATGYIGGDWLYIAANAHPDWELSVLVRSKEKAAVLSAQYPQIRVVHGDLDSYGLLEEEVKNADIVFRMSIFVVRAT